jgi:stearoyl-CoA desaturase (delta-9 desaturase)
MLISYGAGTPDDWVEQNIYSVYPWAGVVLMLVINCCIFGPVGLLIWLVQMLWIPFWAAGVINGLAHWWGYRNGQTRDNSRNISPWGIVIGGEELHNNHHLDPASAKLSRQPWEFDIGWFYVRILCFLRLAQLRS